MDLLPALLKRDRWVIGLAITAVAGIAWGYTAYEARQMEANGVCACAGMQMGGPDLASWSAISLLPLFLMWTVMMVAMMLPSAAPMLLTFAAVARRRREADRPYVSAGIFAGGYLAVWSLFSAAAAIAQWLLHRQALLSPMMESASSVLAGSLLIGAGLFQFTPLKRSCLTRCRAPLEFIMTRWREGRGGAFTMGVEHGAFCAGCCWALMALLFVLGVMNMLWIALLTALVAIEKLIPRPRWIANGAGLGLCAWGAMVLFPAF